MAEEVNDFPFIVQPINPKFLAWYGGQPLDIKELIKNKWLDLGNDPAITHNHRNASHAKAYKLMQFCQNDFGYKFT